MSSDESVLQSVSGDKLTVSEPATLSFVNGGVALTYSLYTVAKMNIIIIQGNDWLDTSGVRIYLDLMKVRIQNVYVHLERYMQMTYVIRT